MPFSRHCIMWEPLCPDLIEVLNALIFPPFFKHTFCNNFKQAIGPGVLQTFRTCAVKPKFKKSRQFGTVMQFEIMNVEIECNRNMT